MLTKFLPVLWDARGHWGDRELLAERERRAGLVPHLDSDECHFLASVRLVDRLEIGGFGSAGRASDLPEVASAEMNPLFEPFSYWADSEFVEQPVSSNNVALVDPAARWVRR